VRVGEEEGERKDGKRKLRSDVELEVRVESRGGAPRRALVR
jgi:hypothetical protein